MKSAVPLTRDAFRAESKSIYLDHNATTPVAKPIIEMIPQWLKSWGNAGSIHLDGRGPKAILRESRKSFAALIAASPLEIIFTSGGSEANNLAIKGIFSQAKAENKNKIMLSSVEHPSVTKTVEYMAKVHGFKSIVIPVNRNGEIDLDFYKKNIDQKVALVSVMLANNETGNIFPIKEMAKIAHQNGAIFHSDGVQALGKTHFDVKDLDVDLMSFSAHKFYALKGAGALYVKKGLVLDSLIHGGAQERKRRAGTENVLAIASLGKMATYKDEIDRFSRQVASLRDDLESKILNNISGVNITANQSPRICASSNMVIAGIDGETLLMNLDVNGFSVSTGAACSSGNPEPSPVLLSMGLSLEEAQSSLRLSLGWGTSQEDIDLFVKKLTEVVEHIRKMKESL